MAYDHGKYEVMLLTTGGLPQVATTATTSVKRLLWNPITDVVIRSVGIINLTTKTGALSFSCRVTATAGAASASGGEFARLTTATSSQKGKVTARKGLNVSVSGGSEVVFQCRTAVSGAQVRGVIYVEQKPYNYGNQTRVRLVTT